MEAAIISFLFITEFLSDITLALKIFVLLAIVSFIKSNMGSGVVAVILMALAAYFVLFDQWKILGGIYILYIMFFMGVGHLMVDFFFVAQHAPGDEMTHIPSHNAPRRMMH